MGWGEWVQVQKTTLYAIGQAVQGLDGQMPEREEEEDGAEEVAPIAPRGTRRKRTKIVGCP